MLMSGYYGFNNSGDDAILTIDTIKTYKENRIRA